jgi:hypothetical protein
MIARKFAMLVTLGACLLGLSGLGSTKNPVTRPMKACGSGSGVITLNADGVPVSIVNVAVMHATHMGLATSLLAATFNENGVPVGPGTLTAANGDQIFVEETGGPVNLFTGGTGRFAGATGTYRTVELVLGPFLPGPIPGTVVVEFTFRNEGTITY